MDGFVQSSQSSTLDCAVARSKEEQARCSNGGCNFSLDADLDAALATLDIDALHAEHAAAHALPQQHARPKQQQPHCSNSCDFTVDVDADFDAALATLDIDALNAEHAASHAFAQQHAYATSTGFLTRPHAAALSKVEEQAGALITWPAWEEYNIRVLACGQGKRATSLGRNHLGNKERFMLYAFGVCNGVSPELVVELLIASGSLRAQRSVRHVIWLVEAHRDGRLSQRRAFNVLHGQFVCVPTVRGDRDWYAHARNLLFAFLRSNQLERT